MATATGGVFGVLLNTLSQALLADSFSTVNAMREAQAQLCIPFIAMQTAFAQLAARPGSRAEDGEISGALRGLLKIMLCFWGGLALLCWLFQPAVLRYYGLSSASVLWFTLGFGMIVAMTPALFGVLQGRQQFRELGIAKIGSDFSLILGVGLVLGLLIPAARRGVEHGMAGLLMGALLALGFALYLTRTEWRAQSKPFDFLGFLLRFVPLTFGLGVMTFMFTEDLLTVQRSLAPDAAGYTMARVVGRAIIFLTAPLVWVMFPKVVSNTATSQETPVMLQALGATAFIGVGASLACTLFPELLLKIVFPRAAHPLPHAGMVPWFAWSLLPLVLANVLISSLLARERFSIIPVIVLVAVGYGVTLRWYHPSLKVVVLTLAGFGSLLLAVSWGFTVFESKRSKQATTA